MSVSSRVSARTAELGRTFVELHDEHGAALHALWEEKSSLPPGDPRLVTLLQEAQEATLRLHQAATRLAYALCHDLNIPTVVM
jgi:hypothetical protein